MVCLWTQDTLLPVTKTGVLSANPSQNPSFGHTATIFCNLYIPLPCHGDKSNPELNPGQWLFFSRQNTTSRKKNLPDPYTTERAHIYACEVRRVCTFLINKESIFTDLVRKPFPYFVLFIFMCLYFENNELKRCHPCQQGIKIQSSQSKKNCNMQMKILSNNYRLHVSCTDSYSSRAHNSQTLIKTTISE